MSLSRQQFSQPHLPGFNIKPTDEHRYPRGFTPERHREVSEAVGHRLYTGQPSSGEPQVGAFSGHHNPNVDTPWMGRKEGEAKIIETLARSTVDPGVMKGVIVRTKPSGDMRDGVAGTYNDKASWGSRAEPTITIATSDAPSADTAPISKKRAASRQAGRQEDEGTLLHELGHHESAVLGMQHSAYKTPADRGKEEAYADDFASTHYRPDPRDVRRGPHIPIGYDQGGKTPTDPYAGEEFDPAFASHYKAARKFPNQPSARTSMADGQVDSYPNGMPKYQGDPDIQGQGRLFMRTGKTVEDTTPDYGQWPLYKSEPTGEMWRNTNIPRTAEVDLPTIRLGRGAEAGLAAHRARRS